MAYTFTLHPESLKRRFAIYIVVAKGKKDTKLYVGKTGDNREGCNPLISRCGNHFSYNKIHSQVRNKLKDYERRQYTYVFDHFNNYPKDEKRRRMCIERINEMERWMNVEIQNLLKTKHGVKLLNEYGGVGHVSASERKKRARFRTKGSAKKIQALVSMVEVLTLRRIP